MPDLRSKLKSAADAWCKAHDAPPSRLGKAVAADAAFFDRVEGRDVLPCTVATLEKFARFLADPANWPDGVVAEEAKALAHVVGVTPAGGAASAGKSGGISRSPSRPTASLLEDGAPRQAQGERGDPLRPTAALQEGGA